MNLYYKLNLIRDMNNDQCKSKKEIRKMLHPTLENQFLPDNEKPVTATVTNLDLMFTQKHKVKVEPKFFSRFKEFNKMPPSNLDVPIIRNSSPYISEEELVRQEYLKSKEKWIDNKSFKNYFGQATHTTNFIPNYVTITPSEPPILHKFREIEQNKWIGNNFKF